MKSLLFAATIAASFPLAAHAGPERTAETLSQVIINTRMAVAENFVKPNAIWWLPDGLYRYILARNSVLPAAIVGKGIHPTNADGAVTLKMLVASPRNEKNRPDAVEAELLRKVVATGSPQAASTKVAAYHARPIKAAEWCLRCHGTAAGDPDPVFPQFKKEGWKAGEVVGAAVARVKR